MSNAKNEFRRHLEQTERSQVQLVMRRTLYQAHFDASLVKEAGVSTFQPPANRRLRHSRKVTGIDFDRQGKISGGEKVDWFWVVSGLARSKAAGVSGSKGAPMSPFAQGQRLNLHPLSSLVDLVPSSEKLQEIFDNSGGQTPDGLAVEVVEIYVLNPALS